MPGHLNLAKVPFRNERFPRLLYGMAATILVTVTVVHAVLLTRYLLREREELDVKVGALEKELADLEGKLRTAQTDLNSKRSAVGTERIRFLAAVYQQKSFSWTGLFNELEVITPAGVLIKSVAPAELGEEETDGQIQVSLEVVGRSLDDVLEMVKRLEANRLFNTVLPLKESTEEERDGGGVAATLTLQYLPPRADSVSARAEPEGQQETAPVPADAGLPAEENTEPASPTRSPRQDSPGDESASGDARLRQRGTRNP
jgi:Tfp pilus assembly protein PilN